MEETTIILMERNSETGYLEREVNSYTLEENGNLIEGIYLVKEEDGEVVNLKLTTDRDVEDDEFDSIYDNYNMEEFGEMINSIEEVDDTYNPTWEIKLPFIENRDMFQDKLQQLVNKHKEILDKAEKSI
ncbi:DUF6762 family protein [Haloimpatiens lingqiaonensis]|uniref:DUF6762 family protein n=1 Tax=Haloimpatiens lingqiaonensis TaxID=1380675 RepID=UPI0010FD0E6C|nr:DUF6762 family protein [Haloimpatiens lingqiaonensis]